ncbi:probable LRR receptor-like serine/threonine-protein kinase At3g47570 [Rhodamnia argentea]|uniref:Probable LRR receptor-like serine/threonine-protein kinase At3g47570 n=1 Tax=Rhodamnia argentea TaxID=178133 RepID=A0ABM3GYJ4_9MYRT|nr:probable LRR receptor-like serine/threonine-protein kinase At3g47570 [Rhodamnia argentea]
MEPRSISFAEFQSSHFLIGIGLALCFTQVLSTTNETDKLSLLAFKAGITEDPLGVLSSWNDSVGFCQWRGVMCGNRHPRVTALDLNSQKLSGTVSPCIGNLSFLRELQLWNNSFDHEIPQQITRLSRLRILELDHNSLVGEIPENMTAFSNLAILVLEYNQLIGKIPTQFGSLSNLQILSLYSNNLIGSMPSSIGNLSSLERLYLSRNNLDGSIPPALGHLLKLQYFYVSANRLSGSIPTGVLNLSSLTSFDIAVNQIRGSLPADISLTLPNLQFFSIATNLFEGQVPPSISNCTKLEVLQLSTNKLSGKMPSLENLHELQQFTNFENQLGYGKPEDLNFVCSPTNATKLERLSIGDNSFGGVLPKCVANLSFTLTGFVVDGNLLYGEIPRQIENLVNLEVLSLSSNKFSGVLPSNLGNLQYLSGLQLSDNNLGGTIPSSLGNLTKLTALELGGNNFQNQIPSELFNCPFLNLIDLSSNNLSGTIPPKIMGISSLTILLDLSHNRLTGVLPMEVGILRFLTLLDISENMLGGEIPNNIGDCVALLSLRMGGNSFHGSIPQSMRSLRGIEELDLSRNNFSGEIPLFLEAFRSLKVLNLSYNNFKGMLPHGGVFENATIISVIGNAKLCGGSPKFQLPKCVSSSSKSREVHVVRLSAFVICGLLGSALVLAILYISWWKRRVQEPVSNSVAVLCPNVSYGTLLKATNGFSSTNLVGVGSFGSVYKGVLEDNRTIIAVKVLHLVGRGALKSFIVECEVLKSIRHRNLLKILTVCSGVDYQGNDFKAIVYDFMDNGSLEQWLHQKATPSHGNGPPKKVNFIQRINIAIDVASALDYLHHQCHIPIIHCDIKPSNILLDARMVAHVGDFGLAKFLLGSSLDTIANRMSSVGLRGTIGYAPPEYAMGCEVSREGDIYSYGILLLEMFTGLSPTKDKFRDNFTLHSFVAIALPGQALEITDHILLLEKESRFNPNNRHHWLSESNTIFQECLVMVYDIGVACSNEVPGRRMSISGVVSQLQKIRQKLFALGLHEQDELPRVIR